MTARNHHYVPQWLQRRFTDGRKHYFYRDLSPERVSVPDGPQYERRSTLHWGPPRCFASEDLYAVNLPGRSSDVVEKEFFGIVDDQAAKSIEFIATDEIAPANEYYSWFLRYLSIQKMRTPKGLDWLRSFGNYAFGLKASPEILMNLLRRIGEMHVTTWAESVWEIVEAPRQGVGFLLTDHPVTAYNQKAFPASRFARYPLDPVIELLGTRTLFPLDSRRCLILSNQEFVENPSVTRAFKSRTNPRSFGFAFFSPLHIARGRGLTSEQVSAVNFVLKKRARRYIAAQEEDWLDPESQIGNPGWAAIDPLFRPKNVTLIKSIWAEYSDGRRVAIDRLGRPITDPKEIAEMESFERHLSANRKV